MVNVQVYQILSYLLASCPREIVKLRCMAAAANIKTGETPTIRTPADASQPARIN